MQRLFCILLLATGFVFASAQGLKLFNSEMKAGAPKPQAVVMNFMERYFCVLKTQKQTTIQTKMADDKVYFRKGTLSDLSQVSDTMPLNISLVDKHYEVTWQKDSLPFIIVVFPAQYDLLLGMEKDEAVSKFKDAVLASPPRTQVAFVPSDLILTADSLYQTQGDTLEMASLTDALYFYNNVRKDSLPVFDASHLDYSTANLFHGLMPDKDYLMYVEQSVYGMKTIGYSLTLRQWLNYCAEWGLKVFFAVEEQREDGMLVLVIAQSKELGFNHMLSVVIPDKFITDTNAVLKVRMTPYIPTHNVKNLFYKEYVNHKRIKWQ